MLDYLSINLTHWRTYPLDLVWVAASPVLGEECYLEYFLIATMCC